MKTELPCPDTRPINGIVDWTDNNRLSFSPGRNIICVSVLKFRMETRTETVASLLQDGLFDIPHYQRSYSWLEPQLTDLLDDLVYLPEGRTHFFGNIILDPKTDDYRTDRGRRFPVYNVVDGQQRLTSVMLLLSAAASKDELVADTVAEDNLLHPMDERPRLLPQDQDKEFFRDSLFGNSALKPDTPSQVRLQEAADFFAKQLESLPDGVSVGDIAERLRYECRVNVVELTDQSEAASIFESINDRGKPLSSLDKTKSFLMYMDDRSSNTGALQNRINERFGSIYNELFVFSDGHESVEDFDEDAVQRFHWGLYDGYNSNQYFSSLTTLKTRLREAFRRDDLEEVQDEIDAYTASLREAAGAFAELFNPSGRTIVVSRRLTRLLELGRLANVLPVLMAAQMRYGDEEPEKMAAIVEQCETFAVRMYALGSYRSDSGRGKLVSLAHRIDSDPSMTYGAVLDRLAGITSNYVDDARFERYLSDPDFYEAVSSRDIRYLLYHYGENLDVSLGEAVHRDISTILSSDFEVEHILARNLDEEDVPEDLEGEFDQHVNRLGNLTIASSYWNKSYGNLPFERKKVADGSRQTDYQSSALRVQQVLADYERFDRETIEARERDIIEFAIEEWSVDRPEEMAPSPPLSYDGRLNSAELPEGSTITLDESDHESLVGVLEQAPSRDWVETTLLMLGDLIGEFDLSVDDPRLVTTVGKGDRIAVSVNNRYVLNANFTSRPRFAMIADKRIVTEHGLEETADEYSRFDTLSGEYEDEVPYYLTFNRGFDGAMTEELREAWLEGVSEEVDRAKGSPYKQHHRPLLYKAAVDPEYREKVLDDAFTDA